MAKKDTKGPELIRTGPIANNKRARYDYAIIEELEAGLVLTGTEVKSMRNGKAQINEAYATQKDGDIWLINAAIAPYSHGNLQNHEEKRPRKCLMKQKADR